MCDMTLDQVNSLELNHQAFKEFLLLETDPIETATAYIKHYIHNLRYSNGRKVRLERRLSMIQVLSVLYKYLIKRDVAECSPSMRTIAYAINPSLRRVSENDTPQEVSLKEKSMAPTLMLVQRTIQTLAQFGMIKIHAYRAESNRNDDPESPNWNNPNFYYEIVPVSAFCSAFKILIDNCKQALTKIKEVFTRVKESLAGKDKKKEQEGKTNGKERLNTIRFRIGEGIQCRQRRQSNDQCQRTS